MLGATLFLFKEVISMEFIRRNQGVWAVLAILSVLILVLFTFFGGAEEEEVAMRGKVEPRRMYLSFNMEYPIGAMYANVGDEVHRGDVLGVLQMDDLTSQAEAAKNSIAHYEEEMKDPDVDADEKKLAYSKLSGLRADLLLKEKFLRQGRIVAPADGVISVRLQNPGEMAVAMKPVFYLEAPNSKWVRAYADEAYAKKLNKGMHVKVMTEIMPAMTVEGNIEYVSTVAEPLPGSFSELTGAVKGYEVRVDVKDPKHFLKTGENVLVVVK